MKKQSKPIWRKVIKIASITVGSLLITGISLLLLYFYQCVHYHDKEAKSIVKAGFIEKQATTANNNIINYAEGPDNGPALLLIHGQTGTWDDYATVLPALSKNWHVFAVDCYGHGNSSHNEAFYSIDKNGDDFIWLVEQVIGEPTVISGHSSGGLLASYIAAKGGDMILGCVLEDPPFFNTENTDWKNTFAYLDTYQIIHEYQISEQADPYVVYYLEHCLWGKLYMPQETMKHMAEYAKAYLEKHPDEPLTYFFLPSSVNSMFRTLPQYDLAYGELFYNQTWMNGIKQTDLLEQIKCPTIYLHALESYSDDGILLAAASNADAKKASELISNCQLKEFVSDHNIHRSNPEIFIDAFTQLKTQLKI